MWQHSQLFCLKMSWLHLIHQRHKTLQEFQKPHQLLGESPATWTSVVPETPSSMLHLENCDISVIRNVSDIPSYKCSPCRKNFKNRASMRAHQRRMHELNYRFVCSVCNDLFFNTELLKEHQAKVHKAQCVCRCKTCGKEFKSYRGVRHHIKCHSEEMSKCEVCGKLYTVEVLKRHVKSHIKGYSCDLCEKQFSTNYQLRVHRSIHQLNPDMYRCEQCPYKSRWYSCVKRHVTKVHSDSRPHICDTCGHSFKDKYNLKRHISSVKCSSSKKMQAWEDL